jgi:hypothetical protein
MNNQRSESRDLPETESREAQSGKQPYASELDDRELEHAHKEKRPVSPTGKAQKSESAPRRG